MALTDADIRCAAKPEKGGLTKLQDGDGLYIQVAPSGRKTWYLRFKRDGVETAKCLGAYPAVTLAKARKVRDELKMGIRVGVIPEGRKSGSQRESLPALAPTFRDTALRWHTSQVAIWKPTHAADVLASLVDDVFPTLGELPVADITSRQVLDVVRAIEPRSVDIARRTRQRISAVFCFAIAESLCDTDPAAPIIKAMAAHVKGQRQAIIDLEPARVMLRAVEAHPAHPATKLAHRLLALTSVRPGELRMAEWREFEGLDGAEPIWRIPAARMKMKREHIVPLTAAAIEVLTAAKELSEGLQIVFPSTRSSRKPISENAIGFMLNRAGYADQHVPHGWRSTFSSVMNERHRGDGDVIELMLAHQPKDAVRAAYNRTLHMARRRELATEWAGLILANAVPANELLGGARR